MNKRKYNYLFVLTISVLSFCISSKSLAYSGTNFHMQILPITECSDGVDNDNDGLIDFPADGGCENAIDNTELVTVVNNTSGSNSGGGGSGQIVNVVINSQNEKSDIIEKKETPTSFLSKVKKQITDFIRRKKKTSTAETIEKSPEKPLFDVIASQGKDNKQVIVEKKKGFLIKK